MKAIAASVVWLVAVVSSSAAAPVTYPYPLTTLTTAEVAKREAAFRKQNPQHWTDLRFDPYGNVKYAVTDDAKLAAADLAHLKIFVRTNAEFFHMDPATADRIAEVNSVIEVVDQSDGVLKGEVVFGHAIKPNRLIINAVFFIDITAKISAADVAKRIAGKSYIEVTTFSNPGHVDCALVGGDPCPPEVVAKTRREVTPAAADIPVRTIIAYENDSLRLVYCVNLHDLKPFPDAALHHAASWDRTFTAKQGAPALPLVVDAVTGDVLTVASCGALGAFR